MSQPYDIIGDIHGHADHLTGLLRKLGYDDSSGVFRHPEHRKVVFLGDYVDRGPKIRETLRIVRGMCEAGTAVALMGNHEFNAIAYATPDENGGWLREHSEQKTAQHQATLDQLANPHPEEWKDWMDWFSTLPMSLDLGGFRAAHAGWNNEAVAIMNQFPVKKGTPLQRMCQHGTDEYRCREELLNGMELNLPNGEIYLDKMGFPRREIRIKWWVAQRGKKYCDLVFPETESAPAGDIPDEAINSLHVPYPVNAPPFFMGHYWLPPVRIPAPLTPNIACLDYSVARQGFLCAYRWDGEQVLMSEKFTTFGDLRKADPTSH